MATKQVILAATGSRPRVYNGVGKARDVMKRWASLHHGWLSMRTEHKPSGTEGIMVKPKGHIGFVKACVLRRV